MKTIQEYIDNPINESTGDKFEPNIGSHAKCYNNLLKWYDKCLKTMNKEEIISLMEYAVDQWKNDNFDDI